MIYVLLWPALFGVWPFAHPDHDFTTLMGALDLILHYSALAVFVLCWWPNRKRTVLHYATIFVPRWFNR